MPHNSKLYNLASYGANRYLSRHFDVNIKGEENIPEQGACIVAPYHININDPYILLGFIKRRQFAFLNRFDHKSSIRLELFEQVRMLGTKAVDGVMIDRTDRSVKPITLAKILPKPNKKVPALKLLQDKLVNDEAICIFPQGERTQQLKLRPGIAYVALAPEIERPAVVPVGFSYEPLDTEGRQTVQVNVGEAFTPAGNYFVHNDFRNFMNELTERMASLVDSSE
jgi:1-acyl-sn-glycerol-3-phosphate acyltransferase